MKRLCPTFLPPLVRERTSPLAAAALLVVFLCPLAMSAEIGSRAGEIEQARAKKAKHLRPEKASKAEERLNYIKDRKLLERSGTGYHSLTLVFGGLGTGQGFALGPQYLRNDLAKGRLLFRTSARAASSGALLLDLQLSAPKLAGDKLYFDFYARHRNYPQIDYFGPGPDSDEKSRTNFRLEDTSADFTFGVQPLRHLMLGVTGGHLRVNTGPGGRPGIALTGDVFSDSSTPGLVRQSSFLRSGVVANFDYRDNPGGPRNGGYYSAKFIHYDDRDLGLHSHRRLDLELQQYIPFFNERRVIALRIKSTLTFLNPNQVLPFYMQPTLGGSDDLRGFRPYRFYGDNLIVVNAEYRWEVFTGLDMAVFFDAGKVEQQRSRINFHDLEATTGIGWRFNVANNVFLRLDVGASHERTMIWFVFGHVF